MHIVCDTVAPLPRPARHMNARPCDVSRSRGRLLKSIPRSENTTGAHRALLPRRLSNFRATTRHKSRGLETPWDHKTRRSSGTKIGPSLEYKSQPCQGMDMMQLIGCWYRGWHYNDVIMGAMVSQITNLTIVHSTADSGAGQRKPQKLRLTGLCEGSSLYFWEGSSQSRLGVRKLRLQASYRQSLQWVYFWQCAALTLVIQFCFIALDTWMHRTWVTVSQYSAVGNIGIDETR